MEWLAAILALGYREGLFDGVQAGRQGRFVSHRTPKQGAQGIWRALSTWQRGEIFNVEGRQGAKNSKTFLQQTRVLGP